MISIVMGTDENYAQHVGVTMASCLANCNPEMPIEFYILNNGISHQQKDRLKIITKELGGSVEIIDVDKDSIEIPHESKHITSAAYLRLLMPELLPKSVEKAIYLDCDLIVRHDISELWNTDLSGYFLAGVTDLVRDTMKEIEIPDGKMCFNSGVMLIDLKKWRESHVSEKALRYARENNRLDQDSLNHVLWDHWLELDPKWNVYRPLLRRYYKLSYKGDLEQCYVDALKDPAIIHFTGTIKAWHYRCTNPYAKDYYQYLKMTPWKDYRPTDKSLSASFDRFRSAAKIALLDMIRR